MRVTSKGQVTIPLEIRQKLGIVPSTDVEFEIEGSRAYLRKKPGSGGRGARLVDTMRRAPKPRPGMTTDELMALTRGR